MGKVGKDARNALTQLLELLADEEEEDEALAEIAEAVAELGGAREAAPVLMRLLRTGSAQVRQNAAAALEEADLSGLHVEAQLRECLSDVSPVVRAWVCWALWRLTKAGEELVPNLLAAMGNESARLAAARLLCAMKDRATVALPQLLALWSDEHWAVRLQAVRATIHITCSDEMALPVLETLRDDPNAVVRSYVSGELTKRGRVEPGAIADPLRRSAIRDS